MSVSTVAQSTHSEVKSQLEHPTSEAVRLRAREVFGSNEKATEWLTQPRAIFDGLSPEQIIQSHDAEKLRRVLETLVAIDFGVYT